MPELEIDRQEKHSSISRDSFALCAAEVSSAAVDAVRRDPDIMGGEMVFAGTRVPVRTLFDHLEAGDALDVFLRSFPSVRREQAIATLELARKSLEADARSH